MRGKNIGSGSLTLRHSAFVIHSSSSAIIISLPVPVAIHPLLESRCKLDHAEIEFQERFRNVDILTVIDMIPEIDVALVVT